MHDCGVKKKKSVRVSVRQGDAAVAVVVAAVAVVVALTAAAGR